MKLDKFFDPKSVAIIGASDKPGKLGYVILKNLIDVGFNGKLYPINPNHDYVLGLKCYKSVLDVEDNIDTAIIVIPAKFVPSVVDECGRKGIKNIIVISGGFGEVGAEDLKRKLMENVNKYDINMIGPNCLGVFSSKSKFDTIFFPLHKLDRPRYGKVAIVSQSGGIGSSILALASQEGVGIGKFVSYGNAYVLDESDFIEYFGEDDNIEYILVYVEGVRNGKKFLNVMKRVNRKKPIIVLKAGKYGAAREAAKSHTGAIAGQYVAYKAAFKTAGVIEANSLDEMFNFLRIFNQPLMKGNNIGVITNGGGLGVMSADAIIHNGLSLPKLTNKTISELKDFLPSYATPANPLDLVADADVKRFALAIDVFMNADEVDAILVNVLFQTPLVDETLLRPIVWASEKRKKPLIVVAPGGHTAEAYRKIMNMNGIPTYEDPIEAVHAIKQLYIYSSFVSRSKK